MKRVLTALVLLPPIVWLALEGPRLFFVGLLALIGLAAFHEFDSIAAKQGIARAGLPGMAAGLAFLYSPEPAYLTIVILALALMAFTLELTRAAVAVLGVVYIFGAWRSAAALRDLNPHWLMIALLVSWAGDTAALYIGRAFGRHKLAPRVSPNKTWEGAIGSLIGGVLAAGVYAHYLIPAAPLKLVLPIAIAGNIAGQIGDLCESAFKRGADVKDSGTMLPGHGGWLDRIDATLFSVPAVYGILRLLTP
jgi:phosphatidate cytidylyltransferase